MLVEPEPAVRMYVAASFMSGLEAAGVLNAGVFLEKAAESALLRAVEFAPYPKEHIGPERVSDIRYWMRKHVETVRDSAGGASTVREAVRVVRLKGPGGQVPGELSDKEIPDPALTALAGLAMEAELLCRRGLQYEALGAEPEHVYNALREFTRTLEDRPELSRAGLSEEELAKCRMRL